MQKYEFYYGRIRHWFLAPGTDGTCTKRLAVLSVCYRYVPYIIAAAYLLMTGWTLLFLQDCRTVVRLICIPAAAFILVSIFRHFVNAPRPYVQYHIVPLIPKNKQGESFPSRHTLSAAIIAMAGLYVNTAVGIQLWVLALVVAATRVLAGVHFVKDVLAALAFGLVFGSLFWVI